MSQGAQNYKAYNILLNLLSGPTMDFHVPENLIFPALENVPTEVNKGPEVYIYVWQVILSFVQPSFIFWECFFFQIIYTDIVFETFCSSSVKYSHKQKDTEKSVFHIKLLKYDE